MKNQQFATNTALTPTNPFGSLNTQVADHICIFRGWANGLERACRSCNHARQWKARGERDTLRRVARHLHAMRVAYSTHQALHKALEDYLMCLEVSIDEAHEEAHGSPLCRRSAIERWKAAGEECALPGICAALRRLLRSQRQASSWPTTTGRSTRGRGEQAHTRRGRAGAITLP